MRDLEIDLCKYFNAPDTILWSLLNYFKRLYSLFIVLCTYSLISAINSDSLWPGSVLFRLLAVVFKPCALDSTSE